MGEIDLDRTTKRLVQRDTMKKRKAERKQKDKRKDPHAVALGRRGGKARMAALTDREKSELGRAAVTERWKRARERKGRK